MTGSRNEFYHLSASKDHAEFVRLSSLFWGRPSGPCAMSHDAWSREEASATSVWSAGSWARMVSVQTRAGFIQIRVC